MKEKYRLLFFKYIYYLCELQKYEKDLISEKIEYIKDKKLMCIEEKECYYVSKYFYLLNSINIDNLNLEEKEFLEKIDSHLIDKSVVNFLEETYSKVLISKNASGKLYYGPFMEQQYEAAADDIVLGLKYDVYGLAKGSEKTVEQVENERVFVNNIIEQLEKDKHFKIKVIVYDELHEFLEKNNPLRK